MIRNRFVTALFLTALLAGTSANSDVGAAARGTHPGSISFAPSFHGPVGGGPGDHRGGHPGHHGPGGGHTPDCGHGGGYVPHPTPAPMPAPYYPPEHSHVGSPCGGHYGLCGYSLVCTQYGRSGVGVCRQPCDAYNYCSYGGCYFDRDSGYNVCG